MLSPTFRKPYFMPFQKELRDFSLYLMFTVLLVPIPVDLRLNDDFSRCHLSQPIQAPLRTGNRMNHFLIVRDMNDANYLLLLTKKSGDARMLAHIFRQEAQR